MPDATGKLSQDEIHLIIRYMESFGKPTPVCEFCGENKWWINEHLVTPTLYASEFSPVAYPQFMIFCTKCRSTKYVGAMAVPGLIFQKPTLPREEIKPEEKHV